jgi:glycosyltransferase involved in cell wall biosynthesis
MMAYKCPYCNKDLVEPITKKKACPFCGRDIYVRSGKLVTEDESFTIDWVEKLNLVLGINRKEFEKIRADLSSKFGLQTPARDVVWTILNKSPKNAQIYSLMADLLAEEDKDPTDLLIEVAKEEKKLSRKFIRKTQKDEKDLFKVKPIFLSHSQLAYIRRLSNKRDYEKAEKLLFMSEPTPAVLDELRKICSNKAWEAKKQEDWDRVVELLEGYNKYAEENKEYCLKIVSQPPPCHTKKDLDLLNLAKEKLLSQSN